MTLPGALTDSSPAADLNAALALPNVKAVFLAIISCGRYEPVWTATGVPSVWYVPQTDEVTGLSVNGVAYTLATAPFGFTPVPTAGTWYWDQGVGHLSFQMADSSDPNMAETTVESFLTYRFADTPQDLSGYFWDDRLADLPGYSNRLPEDFSSRAQTGSGRLSLVNTDHFFDSQTLLRGSVYVPGRLRQNWDAGTTVLMMGVAGFTLNQYVTIATLVNTNFMVGETTVALDLKETKTKADVPYPLNVYTLTDYPLIRQQDIGRAQQVAFGTVLGRIPVCVDTVAREFRVAAHPIKTFDGVRVKNSDSGLWVDVNFLSVDEQNARFTLDAADWSDGLDVVVDFSGWPRDDGSLLDNPAEIALAMLGDLGQAVNSADFEAARLWYDAGYIGTDTTNRYTVHKPSLYLDAQTSALKTLESMMQQVRAYLVTDELGQFSMLPFRTYQAADLAMVEDDIDLLPGGLVRQTTNATHANRISKAVVNYAQRPAESRLSVTIAERVQQQYTRNNPSPVTLTMDSMFTTKADATYWAQSLVNEGSSDAAIYTAKLKWRPFAWSIGQHVHLVSVRHGLDVVVEILGITLNLKDREAEVTFGNLRGFEETGWFWVLSTDVTPLAASLAWPTGGQVPGDESQYKRHQCGAWHNAKANATDTPRSTFDHVVSRWP